MLRVFSVLQILAALQSSFAMRDSLSDLKVNILANSSLDTVPKIQGKCIFGKCDQIRDSVAPHPTWNYCYEWKNNALTCGGVKPGGENGISGYVGAVLYGSKRAVARSASQECANYRNIPGIANARHWLPPSQNQNVNWAHFVHVPQIDYNGLRPPINWVTVTNSFGTVTMSGCTILSKWDAANNVWKVAHLASFQVHEAIADTDVNVMFPQSNMRENSGNEELPANIARGFWVWGKVDTPGTGGLAIYVGTVTGDPRVLHAQKIMEDLRGTDATYQNANLQFSDCVKLLYARP